MPSRRVTRRPLFSESCRTFQNEIRLLSISFTIVILEGFLVSEITHEPQKTSTKTLCVGIFPIIQSDKKYFPPILLTGDFRHFNFLFSRFTVRHPVI